MSKSSPTCKYKQGASVNRGKCTRCSCTCASLRRRSVRSNALEIRAYEDKGWATEDKVEVEAEDIDLTSKDKTSPRKRRKSTKERTKFSNAKRRKCAVHSDNVLKRSPSVNDSKRKTKAVIKTASAALDVAKVFDMGRKDLKHLPSLTTRENAKC